MKKMILLTMMLISSSSVWAWGGRGHNTICEVASVLVQEEGLKKYLQARPHVMGHLCNIPDIYWRSIENGKIDSYSHYIEPDSIGLALKDLPSDYQKIIADYTGKKDKDGDEIKFIPEAIGSSWWRVNQLSQRATDLGKEIIKATPPKNKFEEQDTKNAYNRAIMDMTISMGIMGHYVGDTSQPLHNVGDYDGYGVGHGGLHSFYEDVCVGFMPYTLWGDIAKAAATNKTATFIKANSVIEKMRALSIISAADMPAMIKLDKIQTPSKITHEAANRNKTPAVRENIEKICKSFHPMIIKEMGRSAYLLAHLWDQIYIQSGKPDLSKYRSYEYPFTPDMIPIDYYGK